MFPWFPNVNMRCGWRETLHTAVSWICVHTTDGQVGCNRCNWEQLEAVVWLCTCCVHTDPNTGPKVQQGQLKLKVHRAKSQKALNTSGASVCQQLKGMIECLTGRHICTMVGMYKCILFSFSLTSFFCYRKCSMKMWFRWYERGLNKRRTFQRSGGPRPWHALTT